MKRIRVGAGAGYSGARIEPAVELAERGDLDYLVFECLAERTIAIAQQSRRADPSRGYDPLLVDRMEAVLAVCAERHVRILTNMGAANPIAGAEVIRHTARHLGLGGLTIAAVSGDDVLETVMKSELRLEGTGESLSSLGDRLVAANAYLG